MTALDITDDPLRDLVARAGDEPIVVVNLVRLKPGGDRAHEQYLREIAPILERYGAQSLYSGVALGTLIGDEHWDKAAITRYPSARALSDFIQDPEFAQKAPLRHAALDAGIVHVFR